MSRRKSQNAVHLNSPDVRSIPLEQIDPPAKNPRQGVPPEEVRDLSQSIAEVGLLEPIIVRPQGDRFEVVAGERRYQAVSLLEWETITANVRELTDKEVAAIQLLENRDRADLNPLEEAAAFRTLRDLGHSTTSLAKLVRLKAETIESRLLLFELPESWQERVRSGKLSATAAEKLLPWIGYPQVLEAMERIADRWPMPLSNWRRELTDVVLSLSRNMDPEAADGPKFEPSDEDLERLQVVELKPKPHETLRRAMNCGVWDELQDRAEEPPASGPSSPLGGSAPKANGNGRISQEIPPAEEPAAAAEPENDEAFQARLTGWAEHWLRDCLVKHLQGLGIDGLAEAAEALGIDPAEDWKLSREFLELHSFEQLASLAEELGVDCSQCRDEAECIAVLLHLGPTAMPAEVRELTDPAAEPAAG